MYNEETNYVSLKLDVVFKSFFTNEKNRRFLINFLASILEIPEETITDVQIKNTELPTLSLDDKFSRMDLNLKVNNKNINVEMQVGKEKYYRERAIFYWSRLYDNLKMGESYGKIPEAISIHILDHRMFDCEEYQSVFTFMEKSRGEILRESCDIYFFELPKMPEKINPNNSKEMWMKLIKADNETQLNEIREGGNEIMSNAVNIIYDMRKDERIREEARVRQKSLNDMINALTVAKEEGVAIGRAEGREEGRAEGREEGRAEGREEGMAEGKAENLRMLNLLGKALSDVGRTGEFLMALQNENMLAELCEEFKIK